MADMTLLPITNFLGGINKSTNPEDVDTNQVVDWGNCILDDGVLSTDKAFEEVYPELPTGYIPVAKFSFVFPASVDHISVCFCNYDNEGTLEGRILYYYPAFRIGVDSSDLDTLDDNWGYCTDTVTLPPFYSDELQARYYIRFNYTDVSGDDAGREETISLLISRILFCQPYDGRLFELVVDITNIPFTVTSDLYINTEDWSIQGFIYYKDRLFIWGENGYRNRIGWSDADRLRIDLSGSSGATKEFNGGYLNYTLNDGGWILRDALHYIIALVVWQDDLIVIGNNYIERGEYIGQSDFLIRYTQLIDQTLYAYNTYNDFELQPIIRDSLIASCPYGVALLTSTGVYLYTGENDLTKIEGGFIDVFKSELPAHDGNNRIVIKKLVYHEGLKQLWALYHKLNTNAVSIPPIAELTQDLTGYLDDFNAEQAALKTTFDSEQATRVTERIAYWQDIAAQWQTLYDTWYDGYKALIYGYHNGYGYSGMRTVGSNSTIFNYTFMAFVGAIGWTSYTISPITDAHNLYIRTIYDVNRYQFENVRDDIEAIDYYEDVTDVADMIDVLEAAITVALNGANTYNSSISKIYDPYAANAYAHWSATKGVVNAMEGWLPNVTEYINTTIPAIISELETYGFENHEEPTTWDIETLGWYMEETEYNPSHWVAESDDFWNEDDEVYDYSPGTESYGYLFAVDMEERRVLFEYQQDQRYLKLQLLSVAGPKLIYPTEDFSNTIETGFFRYSFIDETWYRTKIPSDIGVVRNVDIITPDFNGSVHSAAGAIHAVTYPYVVITTANNTLLLYDGYNTDYKQETFAISRMVANSGIDMRFRALILKAENPNFYIYYRFDDDGDWKFLSKANSRGYYELNFAKQQIQFWFGYKQDEDPLSSVINLRLRSMQIGLEQITPI